MTTIAAVDVGSNGIRLAIGRLLDGQIPYVIHTSREAVRLGKDVFTEGKIGKPNTDRSIAAFQSFRREIELASVRRIRAIATSALREARNQDVFIDRIYQASGIEIEIISAEEEARLVHLAISQSVDLRGKRALAIDIGGGSVEFVLSDDGRIINTDSLKIGTVRLLELLRGQNDNEKLFSQLTREYVHRTERWLDELFGIDKIDLMMGIGGNVESLGQLRRTLLGKSTKSLLTINELSEILKRLGDLTYEERIDQLTLRPDRADVIIPASIVIESVMGRAGVDRLIIPNVGIKDGVLLDIADEMHHTPRHPNHDDLIHAAIQIGRKYHFDEAHGRRVAEYALQIFDQTEALHKLTERARTMLEVASLLHDIGLYIRNRRHHKHTYYLLSETPIIGLTSDEMELVAQIARYHRKAKPTTKHETFASLSHNERVIVSKLSAILRVAAALDIEQNGCISSVSINMDGPDLWMNIHGEGDLLLERWAVMKRCSYFEEVFGVQLNIDGKAD